MGFILSPWCNNLGTSSRNISSKSLTRRICANSGADYSGVATTVERWPHIPAWSIFRCIDTISRTASIFASTIKCNSHIPLQLVLYLLLLAIYQSLVLRHLIHAQNGVKLPHLEHCKINQKDALFDNHSNIPHTHSSGEKGFHRSQYKEIIASVFYRHTNPIDGNLG